uniref:O-fucosyltransferase family protein n=1 Tax=Globodera pallida TaxID=36090 RepID=A0A183BMB7_GLOPA
MMKNDEEWNNVWKQLKTKLHSTMVAFGSGSVSLSKLMETFRNDWSTELTSYAVRLGYGSNDGAVYKMLLTMPDEIESGFISATATLAFKVVPKAETNDNLSKIDKSNQYQMFVWFHVMLGGQGIPKRALVLGSGEIHPFA